MTNKRNRHDTACTVLLFTMLMVVVAFAFILLNMVVCK